jgi:hypothetical protein
MSQTHTVLDGAAGSVTADAADAVTVHQQLDTAWKNADVVRAASAF